MRSRFVRHAPLGAVLAGAAWLTLAAPSASAQHPLFGRPRTNCPPVQTCPPVLYPPAVGQPDRKTEPDKRPDQAPEAPAQPDAASPLSFEGGPATRGETIAFATPNFQGDQLGIPAIAFGPRGSSRFPPVPGQASAAVIVPSVRSFKIAENDSPIPRDRAYFGFNYYIDVNRAVNERISSDLYNLRAYRNTFGLEKTFLDGDASLGLRVPLNTLRASSAVPGLGGQNTDVGDLTAIFKYALLRDRETGSMVTAGLAVTAPTGPDTFAGFSNLQTPVHTTVLQPFGGFVWSQGKFFVQGFTALDVPCDTDDVTMFYNDLGVGWYLYRDEVGPITALVPTCEVHINTPLSHRGVFRSNDPAGTPDVIAVTGGLNIEVCKRALLSVGFAAPITGPKPFDWEFLVQMNWRFGPGAGGLSRANMLGGN